MLLTRMVLLMFLTALFLISGTLTATGAVNIVPGGVQYSDGVVQSKAAVTPRGEIRGHNTNFSGGQSAALVVTCCHEFYGTGFNSGLIRSNSSVMPSWRDHLSTSSRSTSASVATIIA